MTGGSTARQSATGWIRNALSGEREDASLIQPERPPRLPFGSRRALGFRRDEVRIATKTDWIPHATTRPFVHQLVHRAWCFALVRGS